MSCWHSASERGSVCAEAVLGEERRLESGDGLARDPLQLGVEADELDAQVLRELGTDRGLPDTGDADQVDVARCAFLVGPSSG